ncbi:MAG: phenylacetic acid degradation protein [Pseudomonadota bacterium]
MGILLQLLGLVVAIAVALGALKRNGVDIGWLNPFTFFHRLRWRRKSMVPPLYALDHPVDVVAVLALAAVQTSGVVTSTQKEGVLALLCQHLSMDAAEANKLWILSSHLLRHRALDAREVPGVLTKSADKFSEYHQRTLLNVVKAAIALEPPENPAQRELVAAIEAFFDQRKAAPVTW